MPSLNFVNELLELGFPELLRDNYAMRLNRTVDELLFSGITTHCPPNASLSAATVCSILRHFPGLKSLQKYPNGDMNVGIMRFKNDTLSDTYEVYRGNHDFDKIGQIVTLNGQQSVDNWYGDECNKVAGSYGETLLKPFLTEDSTMKVYGSDLCSSLPVGFKETSSYEGVDSFKFGPQKKFLGSVVDYPENYCYCPGSIDGITLGQGCMKAGAMEFSACQAVPVVLSFPHFYKASSHFQNAVGGLDPDSDKHESYIHLEPITGIPLKGVKRIQINFQMKGTPAMKITKNARDTLIPFLWVEEVAALGDDQVNLLKDMLLKMLKILSIVRWVLIAVGSLMVLVGCVMSFLSARKEHRHQY
uniref:Sensory neuron membrane protein 2b n=1 Tax=Adelphocoris lineolatus TaxID=236346 RepID=A0A2I4PH13_ADELI|nr:sensory neuron membrane protein 2b [Adelphocoris lineolatus]